MARRGKILSFCLGFRVIAEQTALLNDPARFIIAACGRRSGKTLVVKILLVLGLIMGLRKRVYIVGPTRKHVKAIYWDHMVSWLKPFTAQKLVQDLEIRLRNGGFLQLHTAEVPESIEGPDSPDLVILDEFPDFKDGRDVWEQRLVPMLADSHGDAIFVATPDGRGYYYDLYKEAKAQTAARLLLGGGHEKEALDVLTTHYGDKDEAKTALGDLTWSCHHWPSSLIMDPKELARARRGMTKEMAEQELDGRFLKPSRMAYSSFSADLHVADVSKHYDPSLPVCVTYDFNVKPGYACYGQEITNAAGERFSVTMGEVVIEDNSKTKLICGMLRERLADHKGALILYGDSTGGSRHTSQGDDGSDWDIIEAEMGKLGLPIYKEIPSKNPAHRSRLNAANTVLENADGERRAVIDRTCVCLIRDLEGVQTLADGSIDKSDASLTHYSDAWSYWQHRSFPVWEPPAVGAFTSG